MIKLLAITSFAGLLVACAAAAPGASDDPMHESRWSTPAGASEAASLGFHGPLDRTDQPNAP